MPPLGAEHRRPEVPEKTPEQIEIERKIDSLHAGIADQAGALLPLNATKKRGTVDMSPRAVYQFDAQAQASESNGHREVTRAWLQRRYFSKGVSILSVHTDRVVFDPDQPADIVAVPEEGSSMQFSINTGGVLGVDNFEIHDRLVLLADIADTLGYIQDASLEKAVRDIN